MMLLNLLATDADWPLAIVRITLGVIFFAHGAQKLLGWFGGHGYRNTMRAFTGLLKIPAPFAVLVILAEFFGGLGLVAGFLSRIAAFGILAAMAGAVVVHRHYGLFINWYRDKKGHGFEFHLLAMALAFIVLVEGAGALSLDGVWSKHQFNRGNRDPQVAADHLD